MPRIRLFWVDVRKGSIEFLAGQSWSMLTPNRKGLSALPGDLFYGQEIDLNYLTGLTWTRQPGVRVIFHPNDQVAIGSLGGESRAVHGRFRRWTFHHTASLLLRFSGGELSNNTNTNAVPNLAPDFIAKIAVRSHEPAPL